MFPGKYWTVLPSQPDAQVSVVLVVILQPPPLDSRVDVEEGTIQKDCKDDIVFTYMRGGGGGFVKRQSFT